MPKSKELAPELMTKRAMEMKVPSDDEELERIPRVEDYPRELGRPEGEDSVHVACPADFDQDVEGLDTEQ
eukprot:9458081-Pyramimonas_sp.AAC.1